MSERDRPDEIEITSAMIEAGMKAFEMYDKDDPISWALAAVYRAMERAKPDQGNQSS